MALASHESWTAFACLHTVTNDIAFSHTIDFSNERLHETNGNVESSFHNTRAILEASLTRWLNHASRLCMNRSVVIM